MPTDPLQLTLAVLEYTLVFGGAGLFLWLLGNPRQRQRWLGGRALPQIALSPAEFALGAAVIYLTGFGCSTLFQVLLGGHLLAHTPDHMGLELIVYGAANYGGALLGWRLLFPHVQQAWQGGQNVSPPRAVRPSLSWSEATGYAIGTLLVALPLIILISLGWMELLRAGGLSDEPQDLIALFTQTKSPFIVAGMLLVACVGAPVYEELLFRAGLYRYLRQKLGRIPALLISGLCFGAMHLNWASFLPLAALGILLALVYEATGSIRVAIIAHGLFNLNTIILLLSGLTQSKS
jgi:membrane protease YdiL (CAAX protease family)